MSEARTNPTPEFVTAKQAQRPLNVGYTFVRALKKAAGIEGRYFELRRLKIFWREHPNFQIADVYPRKKKSDDSLRTGG